MRRGDGIVRVKGRVEARPGEDDPTALGARREAEELVVWRLRLLRRSGKVILIQDDEGGGVPRVVDSGKVELGLAVIVEVGGLEVVEVAAVPVLMQQAAIGREQNDLGRVVQVVRRGDQHHVGETAAARRHQETREAEDRREFLGAGPDGLPIVRTATARRRDVVANQRCTLLPAVRGWGANKTSLRPSPSRSPTHVYRDASSGELASSSGYGEYLPPALPPLVIQGDQGVALHPVGDRLAGPIMYGQERRARARAPPSAATAPARAKGRRGHRWMAQRAEHAMDIVRSGRRDGAAQAGLQCAGALPGVKFRNIREDAAASARQAMHGQRSLLLPDLCGSESNAEIRGDLLPRGEFTPRQFDHYD